ncbi:MAG TPA: sigma-54 dependent transcriptional regulator [Ignavibacteria bacterium]|nr:sigma-54 dependent transcriptional regulator [Ignavibacteria bacterium]HRA99040.1 sigma-54 dependent transcriptional regulator [Ignavibacteria bacterium]
MEKVLIVDDNETLRFTLTELLEESDFICKAVENGNLALKELTKDQSYGLVILDMRLPGMNGLEILREIKKINKLLPVIMLTAYGEIKTAVEAMKAGAHDFITKPFDNEAIIITIRKTLELKYLNQEVNLLRKKIDSSNIKGEVIGECDAMKKVFEQVKIVSPTKLSVLLEGESGTGKEVIACMIHNLSERKDKSFIAVDCGAIPESLIESELFGHEKGAFTDAKSAKEGKFELANEGTIFLDEITNLSDSNQIKLLRVIQDRKVTRLGAKSPVKLNIRIISATNIKLADAVNNKKFRQDLYYRLNEFYLELPALRDRKDDIKLLVEHFIKESNQELNKNIKSVSDKVMEKLVSHSWFGNVRELRNVIRRGVLLNKGDEIKSIDIPDEIKFNNSDVSESKISYSDAKQDAEKELILDALKKAGDNKTIAAKILNMNERTLYRKLKKLGIT